MSTFPFDRRGGDMVTQFHGMIAADNQLLKEPTTMAKPTTEMTVKDLMPLLTTAEDRTARIKAVLAPAKRVPSQTWGFLSPFGLGTSVAMSATEAQIRQEALWRGIHAQRNIAQQQTASLFNAAFMTSSTPIEITMDDDDNDDL